MELTLTVFQNNSGTVVNNERSADGKPVQTKEKVCRISARNDKAVLQFTTDYETGKAFELDKEVKVTIQ